MIIDLIIFVILACQSKTHSLGSKIKFNNWNVLYFAK